MIARHRLVDNPFDDAGRPHRQLLVATEAADQALRQARDARRTIRRLAIPAETELREAIGNQLDAVLKRLETIEAAVRIAVTIMGDAPFLPRVEAQFAALEADYERRQAAAPAETAP